MRALVVEDEPRLANTIASMIREQLSWVVDVAFRGDDGLFQAKSAAYDLLLLDRRLPGLGGLELLKRYRADSGTAAVLFLTAMDDVGDIVEALQAGGDDYLVKPFSMDELLARCQALVRRAYGVRNSRIEVNGLVIDTARKTVSVDGVAVELSQMEFSLLEYLAGRAGQVVSKTEIYEHIYDFNAEIFSNVLEVYISNIRKAIGHDRIGTLRSRGYILKNSQS